MDVTLQLELDALAGYTRVDEQAQAGISRTDPVVRQGTYGAQLGVRVFDEGVFGGAFRATLQRPMHRQPGQGALSHGQISALSSLMWRAAGGRLGVELGPSLVWQALDTPGRPERASLLAAVQLGPRLDAPLSESLSVAIHAPITFSIHDLSDSPTPQIEGRGVHAQADMILRVASTWTLHLGLNLQTWSASRQPPGGAYDERRFFHITQPTLLIGLHRR